MNYVYLGITIALMIYLAIGVSRSLRIMEMTKRGMKPTSSLEYFALVLVGIFHTFAWFPYWVVAYREYKKTHANL